MSSILKALKKAEEAKSGSLTKHDSEKFSYRIKQRILLGLIFLSVSVAGILIAFYAYHFRSKIDMPLPLLSRFSQTSQTPQNNKTAENIQAQTPFSFQNQELEESLNLNKQAVNEIKRKEFSKAESILKKAVSISPDDAELHNNLGFALKAQSKYKEAIQQYEKALSIDPDFPEALNNLALAIENDGNQQKALELYTKAISVNPAYAEAHLNIGILLESMGKLSDAESHYHTFITLSKDEELKKKVKEKINSLKK